MPPDGMLLIDLGNSSLKAAMLQQGGLGAIERLAYAGADLVDVAESLAAHRTAPAAVGLASVLPAVLTDMFRKTLARRWACPIRLVRTQSEAHGVRIAYADANRLGVDRWLALIAAHREHQGDVVIADLGSALTVDVLRADGEHLGGAIAPGFAAMFAGLSASTRFPAPTLPDPDHDDLGRDTGEGVSAGLLFAQIGAIREVVRLARERHGLRPRLLLTGGDAARVARRLAEALDGIEIERVDDLVLRGLAIAATA